MHKPHRSSITLIKKPWVPPPARTSKKWGYASTCRSEVTANEVVNPQVPDHLPASAEDRTFLVDPGINFPTSSSSLPNILPSFNNSKTVRNPSPLPLTMDKTSCQDKKVEDLYINLQKLKDDLNRFRPVCISFEEILRLLKKPIFVSATKEVAMNQMVIQTDQRLRQFFGIFSEFENHISSSELFLKGNILELANRLHESSNCKEKLFFKCFEVYDSITASLKFLLEVVEEEKLSVLFARQKELANSVEALQENLLTHEDKIQQLSKDLSSSKKKVQSLQSQKHSLKEKVSQLNAELHQKNLLLEQLKLQSFPTNDEIKSIAANENLIKVIENLKEENEFQKNALKKAWKQQKSRADQCSITMQQFQSELDEKEGEVFALATDRDQWKMQVTNVNSKFMEAEREIEHLKSENVNLQKLVENLEQAQLKSASEINLMMEEKSKLLAVMREEQEKLNETLKSVELMFSSIETEKKQLTQKCASLEAELQAQDKQIHDSKDDSNKDLKVLMPLLEEFRESLTIIKESSLHASNNKNLTKGKSNLSGLNNSSENDLFALVKEIKYLIETKGIHHYSLEDNIRNLQIASAGSRRQEELQQYDQEIAQKQKLLERIEERLKETCVKSPIPDHNPSMNVQEVENSSLIRIASLEEELRNRNVELSSVQQQKDDMEQRNESQIRELQNNLDRVTTNYESLQKYVTVLKSSYTNVFG